MASVNPEPGMAVNRDPLRSGRLCALADCTDAGEYVVRWRNVPPLAVALCLRDAEWLEGKRRVRE